MEMIPFSRPMTQNRVPHRHWLFMGSRQVWYIYLHRNYHKKSNSNVGNIYTIPMGYMEVSKNRGKNPKMDGENHGKPYFLMDDLGGKPTIFGNIHIYIHIPRESFRQKF